MNKNTLATLSPAMQHARYLAETIGPRGSTTLQEAQAADYAHQMLEDAGLQPVKETFTSARSAWRPYALASALALAAEVVFLFGGQLGAVLASLMLAAVLASVVREMSLANNPLRWALPKGHSQNVWAKIPAARQPKRRVILAGHLDSHRTPKVFSSPRWLQIFQLLVPAGLISMALNTIIFVIGIFSDWGGWRSLSVLLAIVAWELSVLTFEADATPFTAGASDNAAGAGIVLSLAARLKAQPLHNTEVWAVCTGCEEVGCYGAADFIARRRREWQSEGEQNISTCFITLDTFGGACTRPTYLAAHTFLTTARSDPELLRLADELAARRPELGAQKISATGGYTESHIAAKAGLRVLTLTSLRGKAPPHWHQPSDTFANLDGAVVQDAETFVWELLGEIDKT